MLSETVETVTHMLADGNKPYYEVKHEAGFVRGDSNWACYRAVKTSAQSGWHTITW